MNTARKPDQRLDGLKPYDPKFMPADAYLSANESPYNVPEELYGRIIERMSTIEFNRYPDPLANELRDLIAQEHCLKREQVLVGNGGDELLFNYALAWGGVGRTFLNFPPAFSEYGLFARMTGTSLVEIPRRLDFSIDEERVLERAAQGDIDFIVLTNPNNPTGNLTPEAFILRLLDVTDAMLLIDEAYFEFAGISMVPYLDQHKNLIILRTLSKAYGLAGLRLGYLLAHVDIINEFIKIRQPYSVNAVSQLIGVCVYEQRNSFINWINETINQRELLYRRLSGMEQLTVFPSKANFILFRVKAASEVWKSLCDKGVLIRDFSATPGLENCLRVSVGSAQENQHFLTALEQTLSGRNHHV